MLGGDTQLTRGCSRPPFHSCVYARLQVELRMPDWREFNPACTPLQYFQTAYSYIMKYQSIFLILLLVYCQWPVWLVSTFKLQYWRYRVNQPRETLLFCQRIFEIRHTTIFDIKDTTLRAAAHWKGATVPLIQVAFWTGKRPPWVSSARTYSWYSFAKRTCHRFKWLRPSATSSLTATPWSTSQPSPSRSSASSSSSLARKCNQHLQKFELENSNVSFRFACGKFEARMFSSTRRPIVYIVCRDSRFRAVLLWCSLKCPYFTGSTTLPCAKWTRFWLKSSS